MIRHRLSDGQWVRASSSLLPGKPGDPGRSGDNNRLFVDAVIWLARTGSPWRDLPPFFGKWNSVWKRFRRWAKAGIWERILAALADDRDFESIIIDGTISGRTNIRPAEKGDSRGVDSHVNLRAQSSARSSDRLLSCACFYTAGQVHESTKAEALIDGLHATNLIGDKAFYSDRFRAFLADRNTTAVIPSNASRARAIPSDQHVYKERHLVELFINAKRSRSPMESTLATRDAGHEKSPGTEAGARGAWRSPSTAWVSPKLERSTGMRRARSGL
jgi:transposase